MTDVSADGAGGTHVSGLIRQVEGLVDAFAGALRELEQRQLTGTDDTGRVTATVTGAGRLTRVAIDPRAMRDLDHAELGQAVLQAVSAARGAMTEGLDELTRALPGPPPDGQDPLAQYFDAVLRDGTP
ncbi:YbaB/EbfC family nucleoid-associated protein [Nonomuraea sp. ATR24]|uniref:YbaB/EbfC family nucleoid-associated protein n=1 Tax=Nonomuraea sp. ATR24 TaxID=1676744 RepID=UPI0035C06EF8